MSLRQRRPRVKDDEHLKFIRQLPCLVTGVRWEIHAAHIKYPDPRYFKRYVGIGEKSDDKWTVPLCADEHLFGKNAQHKQNERAYWESKGIDPVAVAAALYVWSGDLEAGEEIVREFRLARRNL